MVSSCVLCSATLLEALMPTSDSSAIIGRTIRTDVELPDDISEVELRQYALETELRAAGRVLAPYLAGSRR
jgi:hypothetical protein